jgi:hypothetical protein
MTHPPNVCAYCENVRKPVSNQNGYRFAFEVVQSIPIEFWLHIGCAESWCRDFNFFDVFGLPFGSTQSDAGTRN